MEVKFKDNQLLIKLSAVEKVFSFHRDFRIPRKNIVSIEKCRPPLFIWWEIRFPGSFFPGLIKAGTYYVKKRGKEFWLWTRRSKFTYTIELKDNSYKRLVLGTSKKVTV